MMTYSLLYDDEEWTIIRKDDRSSEWHPVPDMPKFPRKIAASQVVYAFNTLEQVNFDAGETLAHLQKVRDSATG